MPRSSEAGQGVTRAEGLFLLGTLVVLPLLAWLAADQYQEAQVVRSEPIGQALAIAASTGQWRTWSQLLLETDEGFYPVGRELALRKGTPLVLQTRANGKRFICDAQLRVCVRTVGVLMKTLNSNPQREQ